MGAAFLPIATLQVKVDLPPAAPTASAAPVCAPITLTIRTVAGNMSLYVDDRPTTLQRLLLDLSKLRTCAPEATKVIIRTDKVTAYGDFMTVVNELQSGGYRFTFGGKAETSHRASRPPSPPPTAP